MIRRLLVPSLIIGDLRLPDDQAHHARNVLRMSAGETVELFTSAGRTASAVLIEVSADGVIARVESIRDRAGEFELTIASAIPKGARADWMIEKLSELGVARFVPLMTMRSVVHPEGKGKLDRWQRIAEEASKQSRRAGVMRIDPLMRVGAFVEGVGEGVACAYLSTAAGAVSMGAFCDSMRNGGALLIGPEGGWTEEEILMFEKRHLTGLSLGTTILRVETAAISAAAVVAARRVGE